MPRYEADRGIQWPMRFLVDIPLIGAVTLVRDKPDVPWVIAAWWPIFMGDVDGSSGVILGNLPAVWIAADSVFSLVIWCTRMVICRGLRYLCFPSVSWDIPY